MHDIFCHGNAYFVQRIWNWKDRKVWCQKRDVVQEELYTVHFEEHVLDFVHIDQSTDELYIEKVNKADGESV